MPVTVNDNPAVPTGAVAGLNESSVGVSAVWPSRPTERAREPTATADKCETNPRIIVHPVQSSNSYGQAERTTHGGLRQIHSPGATVTLTAR